MNLRGLIGLSMLIQMSASQAGDALTVYSSFNPGRSAQADARGYAVISHDRNYTLEKGISELRVSDVAARIDATTVSFQSLTDSETRVLEQRYEYDLVSQFKLMQRFIGETIEVELNRGDQVDVVEGVLLSSNDGITLQHSDGRVSTLSQWRHIRFPALPQGLITKPTLVWRLQAKRGGEHKTRITYQTGGMGWWADYNLLLEEDDRCRANLNAWVSLQNQSGASYQQSRLKLVAGEVNRVQQLDRVQVTSSRVRNLAYEDSAQGFEEKSFFEYHLYTLGRPIDIPDNSTTQVELFPAVQGIDCKKELVVDGTRLWSYRGNPQLDANYQAGNRMDVAVYLRFKNSKDVGLGIPLPEGRLRVSQVDPADGRVEFLGEDVIHHTPKDEELMVKVGNAFDVVGERKRINFKQDTNNHDLWESFELELRNHKEEAVDIVVMESLYRTASWTITEKSDDFEKVSSNRIRFNVNLGAGETRRVTYTVHYTW